LPCSACGASLAEVLAPDQLVGSEESLLQIARDCFAVGTCRRGLTIVNYVLRSHPRSSEASSIKTQFIEFLDGQKPFEGGTSGPGRKSERLNGIAGVNSQDRPPGRR
jgi:hypothetical protein